MNTPHHLSFCIVLFLLSAAAYAEAARPITYDAIRWVDEKDDPSMAVDAGSLVAKVIDNTGLRTTQTRTAGLDYSHVLGYHGIRALYDKTERRNVVSPFYSIMNLQSVEIEGVGLDPVDSRARYGIARGWPMTIQKMGQGARLHIDRLPTSGLEYSINFQPIEEDAIDFEITFTLHKKTREKASFFASWACYMSTYDEVALYSPVNTDNGMEWQAFGEREPFVVGDAVNYEHIQRTFRPAEPPAFPAVYGRIGERVFVLMVDRPDVQFFLVNTGGHAAHLPVQNPAWDFSWKVADYEPGQPIGFRGRLIYTRFKSDDDVTARCRQWLRVNLAGDDR